MLLLLTDIWAKCNLNYVPFLSFHDFCVFKPLHIFTKDRETVLRIRFILIRIRILSYRGNGPDR